MGFEHTYAFAYLFEQFSIYFFKWARCTAIVLKRVRTISLFPYSLYLLLGYSFKVARDPFSLLQHIYPQLTIKPSSPHSGVHSPGLIFPASLLIHHCAGSCLCHLNLPPSPAAQGLAGGRRSPAFRCWIANCSWVSLLFPLLPHVPHLGKDKGGAAESSHTFCSVLLKTSVSHLKPFTAAQKHPFKPLNCQSLQSSL